MVIRRKLGFIAAPVLVLWALGLSPALAGENPSAGADPLEPELGQVRAQAIHLTGIDHRLNRILSVLLDRAPSGSSNLFSPTEDLKVKGQSVKYVEAIPTRGSMVHLLYFGATLEPASSGQLNKVLKEEYIDWRGRPHAPPAGAAQDAQ